MTEGLVAGAAALGLCLPACPPQQASSAAAAAAAAAQDALQVLEADGRSIDATLPALDVGAAPGGWTEALLGYGCARVTAVDPAAMSPALMASEKGARIEYIDRPAQEAATQ
jgi:23S rRNA C2498 (ribose-2'-O)-methylase RlmM